MKEGEIKGQKFLKHVAQHQEEWKKEFKGGIKYNKETFEDLFQQTIIRVYNTIVSNNKDIADYKKYFFISLKCLSIYEGDKENRFDRLDNHFELYDVENEEYKEYSVSQYNEIKRLVKEKFGERYADIFFDYMYRKYSDEFEKMSYTKYSELTGLTFAEILEIISSIKKYLKSNNSFKYYGLDI